MIRGGKRFPYVLCFMILREMWPLCSLTIHTALILRVRSKFYIKTRNQRKKVLWCVAARIPACSLQPASSCLSSSKVSLVSLVCKEILPVSQDGKKLEI